MFLPPSNGSQNGHFFFFRFRLPSRGKSFSLLFSYPRVLWGLLIQIKEEKKFVFKGLLGSLGRIEKTISKLKMWRWNLKVPQEIRRRFSVGDGNGRRCSLTNIRWIIMGWVRFSVWSVDSICVSILPFCCIRDAITNLGFLVGFFFIVSRFTGKRTPSRNSLTSCCLRSSRVNKDIIVSISLEIYFISNEIYKQKKSTRRFPLVIRCLSFRSYKGERKTIDFLVVCVCVCRLFVITFCGVFVRIFV